MISDLLKFLGFLRVNDYLLVNKVYIVSHNNVMQDFLKKFHKAMSMFFFSSTTPKKNYEEQNMWSIFLELSNRVNILITSNAFSEADVAEKKGKKLNGANKTYSSLSIYGIVTAIKHELPNLLFTNKPLTVYV